MIIKNEYPPFYQRVKETFDLTGFNPVFTYGSIIYNPSGADISEHLMVHEQVHEKQQAGIGKDLWWELYLTDKEFRLKQEVEAYQGQYKFISKYFGRDERRFYLGQFAKNLSSKLYGEIINLNQAKELIKNEN